MLKALTFFVKGGFFLRVRERSVSASKGVQSLDTPSPVHHEQHCPKRSVAIAAVLLHDSRRMRSKLLVNRGSFRSVALPATTQSNEVSHHDCSDEA